MRRLSLFFALTLLAAQPAGAVMLFVHDNLQAEASAIKAIAMVEKVETIDSNRGYSTQEITFRRLGDPFEIRVSERFTGTSQTVLHTWQKTNEDGHIFLYPKEGDRVYVTVAEEGGSITSYTLLTPKLEKSLKETPWCIVYTMRTAHVEAESPIDDWFILEIKGKRSGYLHIEGRLHGRKLQLLDFELVVREYGIIRQLHVRHWLQHNRNMTPLKMSLSHMIYVLNEEDALGRSIQDLMIEFHEVPVDQVREGMLSSETKKEQRSLNIPAGLMTDFTLFEMVKRLPFKRHMRFRFHLLEAGELRFKKGLILEYQGRDQGENGLHCFIETTQGGLSYWLDDHHRLIKAGWDHDKRFVRSNEEEATTVFQ